MKKAKNIPPTLPALIERYLNGDALLGELYSVAPSLQGLMKAARSRKLPKEARRILVEVLTEQAETSRYSSEKTSANIQRLAEEDVFTVVAGHQLCIYGGPMFFPYKILSAIRLASDLEKKGIKTVPVYWMASEDHDFEEVNHIFIGAEKVIWNRNAGGAVGPMLLEGIEAFQAELRDLFKDDPLKLATLDTLAEIHAPNRTLAEATRDLVDWMFGSFGIVVLDAADARLKSIFAPIVQRELTEGFSSAAVATNTAMLQEAGYQGQITPRDINLFWMEAGVRERIVRSETGFATTEGAKKWTSDELLKLCESSPEHFSPNVALRPLYQECILPNLGYIGGPGELSYWLQLKGVFDAVHVSFPGLILRDMAVLIDGKAQKRMDQLGLSVADVYGDREAIFKAIVRKEGSHEYVVNDRAQVLEEQLSQICEELASFDPTLGESARAEQKRILKRMDVLQKKVLRADKRKHALAERRLVEFLQSTFPNAVPQERVHNWLMYTNEEARTAFFSRLMDSFNPLDPQLKAFQL
ncbi:MAG: bacillithiol biosynthesis cysteine-adding enzyme BshC [Flavobacteriales bacterium]|nr:bacillithiol biosynthesis cysteine-adding enzyme BshC [Flavobacteriales bacterium]